MLSHSDHDDHAPPFRPRTRGKNRDFPNLAEGGCAFGLGRARSCAIAGLLVAFKMPRYNVRLGLDGKEMEREFTDGHAPRVRGPRSAALESAKDTRRKSEAKSMACDNRGSS